jgi:hypothetical protein
LPVGCTPEKIRFIRLARLYRIRAKGKAARNAGVPTFEILRFCHPVTSKASAQDLQNIPCPRLTARRRMTTASCPKSMFFSYF